MKKLFFRLLFRNQPVKQYLTVSIQDSQIKERACLRIDKKVEIDVTRYQFGLCQSPFIIGVWIEENIDSFNHRFQLAILDSDETELVSILLKPVRVVELQKGSFVLFKVIRSRHSFFATIHQKLLISFFYFDRRNKISFYELESFSSVFLYPRRVCLVCFGKGKDYNLFPMDLQGHIDKAGAYVLGLRNTNVTLKKILETGKVVVCEIDAAEKENIFELGKHHSTMPPALEKLPYHFENSALFEFAVPEIAKRYREIEIVQYFNMGSHTVMIGKVVCSIRRTEDNFSSLHHLHVLSGIRKQLRYSLI